MTAAAASWPCGRARGRRAGRGRRRPTPCRDRRDGRDRRADGGDRRPAPGHPLRWPTDRRLPVGWRRPTVECMTPRRLALAAVPAMALAAAMLAPPAVGSAAPPAYQWKLTPTGTSEQFRGLDAVSAKVAWVA